jgi:hypothetical protein
MSSPAKSGTGAANQSSPSSPATTSAALRPASSIPARSIPPHAKEIIAEWQAPEGPRATHVRSTLLQSSVLTLRKRGHLERYLTLLPAALHDRLLLNIAPEWYDIEIAMAHYQACEGLMLEDEELEAIGEEVSNKLMNTFLGTVLKSVSRNTGIDPVTVMSHYPKFWARTWRGGSLEAYRTGPKDLVARGRGMPCARFRYFRVAYAGMVRAACGFAARRVFCTPRFAPAATEEMTVAISWV